MVDLSLFDGFLFQRLPVWREEPIIKIHDRSSDQIIAEEIIVVECFDDHWLCSREGLAEFDVEAKLGVWLIHLVVGSVVELKVSASDLDVGVTVGADVTRRQVEGFSQVHVNDSVRCLLELLFNDLCVVDVLQEGHQAIEVDFEVLQNHVDGCTRLRSGHHV